VVTDPDQLQAPSTVWRGAGHIAGAAAAIALVLPSAEDDRTRLIDYYDRRPAGEVIRIAAWRPRPSGRGGNAASPPQECQ